MCHEIGPDPSGEAVAKIAFVTARPWPELQPDDRLAAGALERRGASVEAAVWDDAGVDWGAYDAVVLRSCWDYHDAPVRFDAWLDQLAADDVRLWNPSATVRWNADKRYLAELAGRGLAVIPTAYPGPGARLDRIVEERGWSDVVVKPRVSADGHRTHRLRGTAAAAHADAAALVAAGEALVQPYVAAIESDGEHSFVFIAGRYSHAVRKRPAGGEFRVQPRLGGTVEACAPPAEVVAQATAVAEALPCAWLYARIDGCLVDGVLLVMEVELIEPTLFFDQRPESADRFADAVLARIGRQRSRHHANEEPTCESS
jgi:glutathione synthase/RimK-type ligase-like ATP-grasp enzyme